MKTKQNL